MAKHGMRDLRRGEDARVMSPATSVSAPDIHRLEAAVEYLLISTLNAQTPRDAGPVGNARLVDFFLTLLAKLAPAIFLDIGANDGTTAAKVKAMMPACDVIAFEANPAIHAAHLHALTGCGVMSVNKAVASTSGVASIYAPRTLSYAFINGDIVEAPSIEPANTGKSSLLRRNELATYDEYQVAAIALDDIVAAYAASDKRDTALWIDVEGAAYDVLSGAAKALQRTAVIFIETENHEFWAGQKQCGDVARLLIASGFVPLRRDREYADKQFNTVFVHHDLIDCIYPKSYDLASGLNAAPTNPLSMAAAPVSASAPVKKSYRSLAACLVSEIPVFVPVFNNPTYAANMLRQLKGLGIRNIFLVDNNSTSDTMVRFLDHAENDVTVIRLPENKGPYDLVLNDTNYACLPDIFCVTDPDLAFRADMPADFLFDLLSLTNKFQVGKAGLALDLSDRAAMHEEKFLFGDHYFHIWEWEGQFWQEPVDVLPDGSPVFKAKVDTTFALYNKKYFKREFFWDALRVAGPYTCRHLPWYKDTGLSAAEENVYKATQKFSYYMT